MQNITTVGLDLAKNVFQVHGVNAEGTAVLRRQLRRAQVLEFFKKLPACLVGMEACGGAHYWAREIAALGHDVRLIPPAYIKPYIKRGKTDAADAEGICEAVTRKTMRFVPVKTADQQGVTMMMKARELLVRQQTQTVNAIRSHMHELGIITGKGVGKISELIAIISDKEDRRVPDVARPALMALADQLRSLSGEIEKLTDVIADMVKQDADMRRLATIPGVGVITAASIKALVPDISGFKSARHFSAWLCLTPRPHSSGGKERLGRISKMGNTTLRKLLVMGAMSILRRAKNAETAPQWIKGLLARRPSKVVAIAMANKAARIAFALLTKGDVYRRSPVSAG
jgi:transposase